MAEVQRGDELFFLLLLFGYGSKPKVPFLGWLPPHYSFFLRLFGCSLRYRGFDPLPCFYFYLFILFVLLIKVIVLIVQISFFWLS